MPDTTILLVFVISIVIALLGHVAGFAVDFRLKGSYEDILREARNHGIFKEGVAVTNAMTPQTLAAMSVWTVDASQLLATIVGPVLGLILLTDTVSRGVVFIFVFAILGSIIAFLVFVFKVDPRHYHRKHIRRLGSISRVTLGLVPVNLALGLVGTLLA